MKLNKDIQLGLLFVLYLTRAGRASVDVAADNLNLPAEFLQQVSRRLRVGGVIKSIRGPGGGYEIVDEPTVEDVFNALDPIELIKKIDHMSYMKSEVEHRVLCNFASSLRSSMRLVLKRKIKDLCNETQANEAAMFNKIDISKGGH